MSENTQSETKSRLANRFRGFLPVVVDVETGGFNPKSDALLEMAAVTVRMDEAGWLHRAETYSAHIEPFPGANMDDRSLDFIGLDPYHPFRLALPEREALERIMQPINQQVKQEGCSRAILVGHNPTFDLSFVKAAVDRTRYKKNPFHSFSTFDTVTLGGLVYGQTVLAKIALAAGMEWNGSAAHSAVYDAEQTADLFCLIVNRWKALAEPLPSGQQLPNDGSTASAE